MASQQDQLTDKLLAKISKQADELLTLQNELQSKDSKLLELETQLSKCGFTPPAAGTSDLAKKRREEVQHKEQLNALQKQLETTNRRLKESSLAKNQMIVDLEQKTRECRFFENRCDELQQENFKLEAKLEGLQHVSSAAGVRSPAKTKHTANELLKTLKNDLHQSHQALERLRSDMENLRNKNSVLEKALDYRADEIGLSGHADLLAKLAGLRGEIGALKHDLMDKRNKIHNIEEERQEARDTNLSLQQQVDQLQEKLAQSKYELQRLQKGETLAQQLSQVENERDILLEFIQEDIKKNSDHVSAMDSAMKEASEAKRRAEIAQSQLKQQSELVDSQKNRIFELESRNSALLAECTAVRGQVTTGREEIDELKAKLDRKDLESQEMNKLHIAILEQLKAKEDLVLSLNTENNNYKLQLQSLEVSAKRAAEERREQSMQIDRLTSELVPLRDAAALYATNANLRPEIESLQHDYETVLSEKRVLVEELQRLKFYDKQLQDLKRELEKAKASAAELSSPSAVKSSENQIASSNTMSLSQRHVMWTGISALRQLSPVLYENVRSMFQDLFNKEAECRELAAHVKRYKDDQAYREEEYRNEFQKMAEIEQRCTRKSLEDRAYIESMEREQVKTRSARLVIDQLRVVLRSSIGDSLLAQLTQSTIKTNARHRSGTAASFRDSARGWGSVGNGFQEPPEDGAAAGAGYEYDESFSIRRHEDVYNNSLEDIAVGGFVNNFEKQGFSIRGDDGIDDDALPAIFSQALAIFMSSHAKLEECQRELHLATSERDAAVEKASRQATEAAALKQRLADAQSSWTAKEADLSEKYKKIQVEFSQAVALNEKQNALAITLEAKIEELRRQLSVRSAQSISMQQAEQVFKFEMINLLGNFWKRVTAEHGSLGVNRNNWFHQPHADQSNVEGIVDSAAEILSAINFKLKAPGGTAEQRGDDRTTFTPFRASGSINPHNSSPPVSGDVSHHYRHWQSGGKTKSPLSKANQEYVERVSRGSDSAIKSPGSSGLSRSLSQPFTREEFRQFGGSKSFASNRPGSELRVSPQRPSLQQMGSTRELLDNSEILNRLQKAKTAYSFIRSDSVDFN